MRGSGNLLFLLLEKPAAAQPLAGSLTLFEDGAACRKPGFREKLPDAALYKVIKKCSTSMKQI